MKTFMLVLAGINAVMMLLLAAGLANYIRISFKRRAAIGPGWDFNRDERPLLFWLQITVAAWGMLYFLAGAVASVIMIFRI